MTAAEDRRGSTRAADGIDTFITGAAPHWAAISAEELSINLFFARWSLRH